MLSIKRLSKELPDESMLLRGSLSQMSMLLNTVSDEFNISSHKQFEYKYFKQPLGNIVRSTDGFTRFPSPLKRIAYPRYSFTMTLHDSISGSVKDTLCRFSEIGEKEFNPRMESADYAWNECRVQMTGSFILQPVAIFHCTLKNDTDGFFSENYEENFITAGFIESFSFDSTSSLPGETGANLTFTVLDCRLNEEFKTRVDWDKAKVSSGAEEGNKPRKPSMVNL